MLGWGTGGPLDEDGGGSVVGLPSRGMEFCSGFCVDREHEGSLWGWERKEAWPQRREGAEQGLRVGPLRLRRDTFVPGKEKARTEAGWKPVTVLRVMGTLPPRKVVGGAGQPCAASGPRPPFHMREVHTGCVQGLFCEPHPVSWTQRLWGWRHSLLNRPRLSYFKSWWEFPVSLVSRWS